jgi:hypothetical protein
MRNKLHLSSCLLIKKFPGDYYVRLNDLIISSSNFVELGFVNPSGPFS